MSILIYGTTRCPLCEKQIESGEEAISFPAFVWNEIDPLGVFNDASVHVRCLDAHPMRQLVEKAMGELRAKVGPGKRHCVVCGSEIMEPSDYLMLPRLVDDDKDPLFTYNYAHFHRSHIRWWKDYDKVIALIVSLNESRWKGEVLKRLLAELEQERSR